MSDFSAGLCLGSSSNLQKRSARLKPRQISMRCEPLMGLDFTILGSWPNGPGRIAGGTGELLRSQRFNGSSSCRKPRPGVASKVPSGKARVRTSGPFCCAFQGKCAAVPVGSIRVSVILHLAASQHGRLATSAMKVRAIGHFLMKLTPLREPSQPLILVGGLPSLAAQPTRRGIAAT